MPDQTQGFTPKAANDGCKATEGGAVPVKSRFVPQLNFANAIAMVALFVALGGIAVAAGLPRNSVGQSQLKRGAVTQAKLKRAAVTSGKLAPKSVTAGKLGPNAVLPGNIGNGAITSAKIGAGAVIASSIKNGVVTTNKLNSKAVTADKLAESAVTTNNLANNSVTPAKLSKEFGPLVNPLKSGQTLQGSFAIDGGGEKATLAVGGESFQFPLTSTPAVNVLAAGATSPACPGLGSGAQAPAAVAGNLCIYITTATNLKALTAPTAGLTRLGFGLEATPTEDTKPFSAFGQWAVTAP
jgi:hypothetical protein